MSGHRSACTGTYAQKRKIRLFHILRWYGSEASRRMEHTSISGVCRRRGSLDVAVHDFGLRRFSSSVRGDQESCQGCSLGFAFRHCRIVCHRLLPDHRSVVLDSGLQCCQDQPAPRAEDPDRCMWRERRIGAYGPDYALCLALWSFQLGS